MKQEYIYSNVKNVEGVKGKAMEQGIKKLNSYSLSP
jgi:hypothetical protein